jgi:tetratricopeptide (TPR) repeat protein
MADQGRRGQPSGRGGGSRGHDGRGGRSQPRRDGRSDRPRTDRGPESRPESRPASRQGRRDRKPAGEQPRTAEQRRYDGPPLPDDVTGRELDPAVRRQLRSLPERLGTRVARHLVAAGRLLDTDPETAYQHTLAARARATRLAVVREACGEAAYLAGHYAEALTELRAARRMNGAPDYLPLIADSERAVGRPERALALGRDPGVEELDPAGRIEMMIVVAGARRDLGQPEVAVRLLEVKELHSRSHAPWAARLRYAYADALFATGRRADAVEWFHRVVAVDSEELTDARERLAELDNTEGTDTVEGGS